MGENSPNLVTLIASRKQTVTAAVKRKNAEKQSCWMQTFVLSRLVRSKVCSKLAGLPDCISSYQKYQNLGTF
jgi:hypothetical protein